MILSKAPMILYILVTLTFGSYIVSGAPTRRPTKRPTRRPTNPPTKRPTRRPTRRPVTRRPSSAPVYTPTSSNSAPTFSVTFPTQILNPNPNFVYCPGYGSFVQCSGCSQFCPDGNICPNCLVNAPVSYPTYSPALIQPQAPYVVASPIQPTGYTYCPGYGLLIQCNGCQYCPDGRICPNCATNPVQSPTQRPIYIPPTGPTIRPTFYSFCPGYGGYVQCRGCDQFCPNGEICPDCLGTVPIQQPTPFPTTMKPTTFTSLPTNIPVTAVPSTTRPTPAPVNSTFFPTFFPTISPTIRPTNVITFRPTKNITCSIDPIYCTLQNYPNDSPYTAYYAIAGTLGITFMIYVFIFFGCCWSPNYAFKKKDSMNGEKIELSS